jgi:hypothetical protein
MITSDAGVTLDHARQQVDSRLSERACIVVMT